MNDRDFLLWIQGRLVMHGDDTSLGFMHRLNKIALSMSTGVKEPFAEPTPEVKCLRNVSQLLYDAFDETQGKGDDDKSGNIEKASRIAWDAYVAVRNFLGDSVK